MKSALGITGFISLSLIIIGSLFKIQHWPGAGIMLILGTFLFATPFLILLLIHRIKNREGALDVVSSIALTMTLWFVSVGMLFKVQHWPGAGFMMIIGLTLGAVFFLPVFILSFIKKKRHKDGMDMMGILIGIAGISMAMAINVSKNILVGFVSNERLTAEANLTQQQNNDNLAQWINQTTGQSEAVQQIQQESDAAYALLESYKRKLMAYTDGYSAGYDEGDLPENYTLQDARAKDNFDKPTEMLIGSDPTLPRTDEHSAIALKTELSAYRDQMISRCQRPENKAKIARLLYFDGVEAYDGYEEAWEVSLFYSMPLVSVVQSLSTLQQSVLSVEALVLQDVMMQRAVNPAQSTETETTE